MLIPISKHERVNLFPNFESINIGYCTPIGVTIVAYFVLREKFSVIQIGACVGALIGVLIIAR